jgi:Tol biopolymer transport system component
MRNHSRPIAHLAVVCLCLNLAGPAGADTCLRPTAGLAAWWPLDGTVGSTATDLIGGSDGALIGTTAVMGKLAGARRFAPADRLTADGSHALNITGNQVTIEAWIKLENAPTSDQTFTAIGKTTFPSQQAYQIVFETGPIAGGVLGALPANRWRFEYILTNASGSRVHNQNTGVDISVDGNYHHFAMVYDGTTVRLYVDAVLHGTFGFTGNLLNVPGEPLTIFGGAPFAIDEVGVYSRALSQAEIKAIVCASSPAQPESGQLAFTSNRSGDFDIYLMDDDGSNVVQLTDDPATDGDPAWSPDGQRIAFASNRDGDFEIFVMNADGTDVVQVTHTDASGQDRSPKWSPDGRFLVFHRPFEPTTGRHIDLYQIELATGTITRLTFVAPFGSGGGAPDWSPDTRLIYQRHSDLSDWELVVRDTNGTLRQLTFNNWDDHDPDWFPGGVRAAFTSSATDAGDIRTIVLATGTQTSLTSGPDRDGGAAVSCDGSRIAFVRVPQSGVKGQIRVMAADGSGQVNISNNTASDSQPDWRCTPQDATPPLLALPDTITVEATSASGAVATYSVSATDDEDPNPSLSCTPPSGSTFPIGASAVTCTATDASGNIATASLTVIVRDTTPPVIDATRTPAPNANSWNNTDVTIDFSCTDAASGVASQPLDATLSVEGANQSASASCQDTAGNTVSLTVDGINIDKTPPIVTVTPSRGPDANGWYNHAFEVTWSGNDALSGTRLCSAPAPYGGPDTAAGLIGGECADQAGNVGRATFSFRFDATPPSIAIVDPADGAAFLLRQTATASYTCGDATSGVAGCAGPVGSGATLDTNAAGARMFTVTAVDVAGNIAALTHQYSVAYRFEGFFAPLNNLPTNNRGPAGRTFPVKFALHDASGGFISDPAAIITVSIVPAVCGTVAADVDGEQTSVDTGGLKYDTLTGVWHFNWQTMRSQAGCWLLEVHLADGSVHPVAFELR